MSSNLAPQEKPAADYFIGRYRILARLGKGGMGVVYLGRDQALDRDVAVKTLRMEGSADTESRGRFEIEAKAAARLQHPNIVTVFELGEDRGVPFIAMELLGGQDLETLLRASDDMSVVERLDIVIQTLRGLDFAHTHRIIHRDMKPSNIRVLDDGSVKILDFGIAKVGNTSVTQAGMMVGTPFYMSPEHIRGGVLDGRSDVFAMGVILHELFAGVRPFRGDDSTQVLYQIVREPHPPLDREIAGPRTPDVQRIIDRALAKEADDRFGSAAMMADELVRVRERCPTPHIPASDAAALNTARKALASPNPDPAVLRTVEAIALRNPGATEPRRLLRALRREPSDTPAGARPEVFPELDASFSQSVGVPGGPTASQPHTVRGSATTGRRTARPVPRPAAAATAPGHSNLVLYLAMAACLFTGSIAAFLYFNRPAPASATAAANPAAIPDVALPSDPAPDQQPPDEKAATTKAGAPATNKVAARTPIEITSEPAGASIKVDGKAIGVTPLSTAVTPQDTHAVSLSLRGYETKDLRIKPPIPATVSAQLVRLPPPGDLVVQSTYPVTVSVGGRVVATNQTGVTTSLPAGTHEVLIESAAIFLKQRQSIRVEAGESFKLQLPATGQLGVRASPDNCKVFVDGTFVDYPPIIDRNIVAGSHVIGFEWPDGTRSEEKVDIRPGRPSYVMGRRP